MDNDKATQPEKGGANDYAGFQTEAVYTPPVDAEPVEVEQPKPEAQLEEPKEPTPEKQPKEEEPEEASKAEADEADAPKKGRAAKRIDELTAKYREAEREKLAAQEEARRVREEYGLAEKKSEQGAPKPDDFDGGELDPAYIEALTDFKAKERVQEELNRFRSEQEADRQQRQWNERFQNFEQRLRADEDHGADAMQVVLEAQDLGITPQFADIVMRADNGPEILATLNKDRAELSRICALPAHLQAFELAKMTRTPALEASPPAEKPRTTKAPDPLPEAKGRSSAPRKRPEKMSTAEYERWANEQEAKFRSSGW